MKTLYYIIITSVFLDIAAFWVLCGVGAYYRFVMHLQFTPETASPVLSSVISGLEIWLVVAVFIIGGFYLAGYED